MPIKQNLWTTAPAAAAPADKDEPGASSQDRSDGGSGQEPDSAEGWAGGCSPGTPPGTRGCAAGGHKAEKGAAGAGTRARSCWDRGDASVKIWDSFTYTTSDDCKEKSVIFSRCQSRLRVVCLCLSGCCVSQIQSSAAALSNSLKPNSVWVECGGDPDFMENCFECEKSLPFLPTSANREDKEEEETSTALLLVMLMHAFLYSQCYCVIV